MGIARWWAEARNPALWWVIAWANALEVLPTALVDGDVLVVPSPNYVSTKLFSNKTKAK